MMVVPSPNWPLELSPQQYRALFAVTPHTCVYPVEKATNGAGCVIGTGVPP